jgi:hypothetical protein
MRRHFAVVAVEHDRLHAPRRAVALTGRIPAPGGSTAKLSTGTPREPRWRSRTPGGHGRSKRVDTARRPNRGGRWCAVMPGSAAVLAPCRWCTVRDEPEPGALSWVFNPISGECQPRSAVGSAFPFGSARQVSPALDDGAAAQCAPAASTIPSVFRRHLVLPRARSRMKLRPRLRSRHAMRPRLRAWLRRMDPWRRE